MAAGKKIDENKYTKKETLYIAVCIAFFAGFLSGIFFSVFKSGSSSMPQRAAQQQTQQQNISAEDAAKIMALEKEVAMNPNNLQALIKLGHEYFDSHQHKKAISMYQKALDIDPSNADIWTDMGVMYRRSNQPHKAIEAFETAMEKNPTHEVSRFNKGIVLFFDLNDFEGAKKAWQDLLKVNPDAKTPNGMPLDDFIKEVEKQSKEQ